MPVVNRNAVEAPVSVSTSIHCCSNVFQCVAYRPFGSDHILLSLELFLEAVQLILCEDRSHSLTIVATSPRPCCTHAAYA